LGGYLKERGEINDKRKKKNNESHSKNDTKTHAKNKTSRLEGIMALSKLIYFHL